jgi:hypothetical protein
MRRLSVLPLLAVLALARAPFATAQTTTVEFFDGFQDNRNDWSVPPDCTLDASGGRLRLGNACEYYRSSWRLGLDLSGRHAIFVQTTFITGDHEKPYGLQFGGSDGDNFWLFAIAADGTYRIGKWEVGEWSTVVEWTESEAIAKGTGATNTLLIKRRDGTHFYINSVEVENIAEMEYFGNHVGVAVEDRITVDFSEFLILRYERQPVESELSRRLGQLVEDYRNDFANCVGAIDNSLPIWTWPVREPLPGFDEQSFTEYAGRPTYFATVDGFSSHAEAMSAFLHVRDQLRIADMPECVLIDPGDLLEGGVIVGSYWSSLEAFTHTPGPFAGMRLGLAINPPDPDGPQRNKDEWTVTLSLVHGPE